MALLEVTGLQTEFAGADGAVRAVDGVSFSVEQGKSLCIVGESGCGKTATSLSLLRLLPGSGRVVGGAVMFEGRDLTALSERELDRVRGREIAMVFQDPMVALNPTRPVGVQVAEGVRLHLGLGRREARRRAIELLEEVEMPRAAAQVDAYPHQLSGGMRQRAVIAMAIACRPKLLIADEPTTALDVSIQAQILRLLDRLRHEHDMATILITHDMGVVAEVADDVAVMYAGQIVEYGPVDSVFDRREHPYTEVLFGAIPQVDGPLEPGARLRAIPGAPPDLAAPPSGCRFAPRCPHGDDESCAGRPVDLVEVAAGHWVRSTHPRSRRADVARCTATERV